MTTITKERLLTIKQWRETYGPGSNVVLPAEEAEELARIALASLEAEPIAWECGESIILFNPDTVEAYAKRAEISPKPLFSAPPALVVPDKLPREYIRGWPLAYSDYAEGWNDCRTAMLQGVEPVSNHDELALYYLQGQKDGLEWAAQLAEANHPLTGDWLYDDPLELAKAIRKGPDMPGFAGSPPVTPDGWISCSDRMPNEEDVLVYCSDTKEQMVGFHKGKGLFQFFYMNGVEGVCEPSHWMPLPEPPQEVNRG
ncbi:TPA: DUF551 domain-containing protein [Salmonella enterica subsp. enterica serovar Reading]